MKNYPIEALIAIVERETMIGKNDLAQYGYLQTDPDTPAYLELCRRLKQPDKAPGNGKEG